MAKAILDPFKIKNSAPKRGAIEIHRSKGELNY
jgi:hypothetical protein